MYASDAIPAHPFGSIMGCLFVKVLERKLEVLQWHLYQDLVQGESNIISIGCKEGSAESPDSNGRVIALAIWRHCVVCPGFKLSLIHI